jgi:hypothetical protein
LSELGFRVGNVAGEGTEDLSIVAIAGFVRDPYDRLVDDEWAELSEVVGMVGCGIARAAVIGKWIDSPESPEAWVTVGIPGPAVERIAAFSPWSQCIAAVAVSQMISQAKPLETRVESRWAVPERADARATAAAVVIDGTLLDVRAHDCGLTAVGQGR